MGKVKGTESSSWIFLSLFTVAVFLPFACNACGKQSVTAGNCLHTYLERDFPSIEAFVFPKKPWGYDDGLLLLDGPELEDQCYRLQELVECLEHEVRNCHNYDDFFRFYPLVSSIRATFEWVCAKEHLRDRFRVILHSLNCLENSRKAAADDGNCSHSDVPLNIWQKIIRQQIGTEVCGALIAQEECLGGYAANCSSQAYVAYRTALEIFLQNWCDFRANAASNAFQNRWLWFIYSFALCFFCICKFQFLLY